VREELFYQRGTPPEATYLFKHALIRDAAYQSMLRATRQRHHRRVAETLIERLPELARDQPELVAQHWGEAGDAETAIEWWLRASERAVERTSCAESAACARRGLALLDQILAADSRQEQELRLLVLLGGALMAGSGWAHPDTMAAWQRARVLSENDPDLMRVARIRYYLCSGHTSGGRYPEALAMAAELQQVQNRLRHPAFEVACHYSRAVPPLYAGRLSDALRELEAACDLSDRDPSHPAQFGLESPGLQAFGFRAWGLWAAGLSDRSRDVARRGREHASRNGNVYELCYLNAWSAVAALLRRDWNECHQLGSKAYLMANEQGFPMLASAGAFAESSAAVKRDQDPEAIERYAQAMAKAGATGNQSMATVILGNFADLLLELGRYEEAARYVEGALGLSRAIDERFYLAELLRLRAQIALQGTGSSEEAEALLREALEVARSQEAKALELRAATSLARLWRDQGKRAEAHDLLAPVYTWFTEGFDTLDLVEAKALLDALG
jgi:tetratricopeptide (TPR) repeat protein